MCRSQKRCPSTLRPEHRERIDRSSLPPILRVVIAHDLKMQMRRKRVGIPCRSNESNDLAAFYTLSLLQSRTVTVEMPVHQHESRRWVRGVNRKAARNARVEFENGPVDRRYHRSVASSHDIERVVRARTAALVVEAVDEILCRNARNRDDDTFTTESVEISRQNDWSSGPGLSPKAKRNRSRIRRREGVCNNRRFERIIRGRLDYERSVTSARNGDDRTVFGFGRINQRKKERADEGCDISPRIPANTSFPRRLRTPS